MSPRLCALPRTVIRQSDDFMTVVDVFEPGPCRTQPEANMARDQGFGGWAAQPCPAPPIMWIRCPALIICCWFITRVNCECPSGEDYFSSKRWTQKNPVVTKQQLVGKALNFTTNCVNVRTRASADTVLLRAGADSRCRVYLLGKFLFL